jgi:PAS domain S-box-containing protein
MLDTQLARLEGQRITTIGALSRYVRTLPVAALVSDNAGSYVSSNAAATRLTGYPADELRRMSVWDLTLPTTERETDVLWRSFVRVGIQRGTITLKTKKGSLILARYVAKSRVLPGFHISLLQRRRQSAS